MNAIAVLAMVFLTAGCTSGVISEGRVKTDRWAVWFHVESGWGPSHSTTILSSGEIGIAAEQVPFAMPCRDQLSAESSAELHRLIMKASQSSWIDGEIAYWKHTCNDEPQYRIDLKWLNPDGTELYRSDQFSSVEDCRTEEVDPIILKLARMLAKIKKSTARACVSHQRFDSTVGNAAPD